MAACPRPTMCAFSTSEAVEHGAHLLDALGDAHRLVGRLGPPEDHDAVVAAEVAQLAGVDHLDVRQHRDVEDRLALTEVDDGHVVPLDPARVQVRGDVPAVLVPLLVGDERAARSRRGRVLRRPRPPRCAACGQPRRRPRRRGREAAPATRVNRLTVRTYTSPGASSIGRSWACPAAAKCARSSAVDRSAQVYVMKRPPSRKNVQAVAIRQQRRELLHLLHRGQRVVVAIDQQRRRAQRVRPVAHLVVVRHRQHRVLVDPHLLVDVVDHVADQVRRERDRRPSA